MKFRLWMLFYVFAVVAASICAFDMIGIVLGAWVGIGWMVVCNSKRLTVVEWLVCIAITLTLVALLIQPVTAPSSVAMQSVGALRMKYVTDSLLLYDRQHGRFPANIPGEPSSQPLHSWRVFVLPHLEEQQTFATLQLDEPWDSLANSPLTTSRVEGFDCPTFSRRSASELDMYSVTGAGTMWPPARTLSVAEVTDDPASTVILIETKSRGPWGKPGDLTFDEALELLTSPIDPPANGGRWYDKGFFYKQTHVRNVAMASGAVYPLRCPIDEKLARAMLTVDGGDAIDQAELMSHVDAERDYAKIVGVIAMGVLTIAPAFGLRWRKD